MKILTEQEDNSELYLAGWAFMTCIKADKKQSKMWYLDFYLSKYIYNCQKRVIDLQPKFHKFVTVREKISRLD